MAEKRKDKVLVINPDPEECAVLVEAALEPFGYDVQFTGDGGVGLGMVLEEPPDVILLDLHPQNLSGQDVMAALSAEAIDIPVIILADEGAEKAALQVFRLGAKDYLVRPIRETELIQAVERALTEVRFRRERESLLGEVKRAAEGAEQRLRELKTLMSVGKSVTALTSPREVLDRVVRAAVQLTKAEAVGILLRDDQGQMILQSGQNLSRNLQERIGQPVQDDLAALVMNSQETYLGSGEGLKQFHPAQEGASAVIYAPLAIQEQAVGVLWVANTRLPFEPHMKDIMTALADYAAIAIVNARLFAAMQERSQQLDQQLERMTHQLEQQRSAPSGPKGEPEARAVELAHKVRGPLSVLLSNMNLFRTGQMGRLPASHQAAVDVMHRQLEELIQLIDSVVPPDTGGF